VHFQTMYSRSIIVDKLSFLALLNSEYNGGYKFSTYQWYRDYQLIPGATESYLPIDAAFEGAPDYGHEYMVRVTRVGEIIPFYSCVVKAGVRTDVEEVEATDENAVVKRMINGHLYILRNGRTYDVLGCPVE